ncbi:hypothetical protein BpHYR1_002160, partial [Brachionus plicatilis]
LIQASKFAFFIRIEAGYDVNFLEYKRPAYIQNPLIFGEIRFYLIFGIFYSMNGNKALLALYL